MIKEKQAKAFCCEDISMIENYDLAIADQTQTWDCHHRNGIQYSKAELISKKLYWKRPASELIFLTRSEHIKLHALNRSAETRAKIGAGRKGKLHTEEAKAKIGAASKKRKYKTGKDNPRYGTHQSAETRAKIGAKNRGRHQTAEAKAKNSEAHKGEKNGNARAVYQIDKTTGKTIKKWGCVKNAAKALNIHDTNICACCKGKYKHAGGYVWKYADDLEKVV